MKWYPTSAGRAAAVVCFALLALFGCESAEDYKKTPSPQPVEGSVRISATTEQMQFMRGLAASMESARALCATGDTVGALWTVDSLVAVVEGTLDTISLDQSLSEFLTIYVADGYGTLQEWHTARHDSTALRQLTYRYQSLAKYLQTRRDSSQSVP